LIRTLALALGVMHERKVIHRDLKPSNIFLKDGKEPVILDFGLALLCGDSNRMTTTGRVVGTLAYLAPEQAAAEKGLKGGWDIYSLGVILYELLTGRVPFSGTPGEVCAQILCARPQPPTELRDRRDAALDEVCLKALNKDVEDRYASMA